MANPYDVLFRSPELVAFYTGMVFILAGWTIWSVRRLFRWGVSIKDSRSRWEGILMPIDVAADILWFTWTLAAWFLITGAFLYVVV